MTTKVRALFATIAMLSTLGLSGCGHYVCGHTFGSGSCTSSGTGGFTGGGTGSGGQTAFVYFVGNTTGQDELAAEGLNVGGSGTFAPLSSFVSPTLPDNVVQVTVVNKEFLYMPFINEELGAYSIDSGSGALTAIGTPISTGAVISQVADPTGRFLFIGTTSGVTAYVVNADGSLALTGSVTTTHLPLQMATDGLGKYLYAADGSSITAFSYSQTTGALTAVSGSPFVTNGSVSFSMAQIAGEATGKYLIGITALTGPGAFDSSVYVFSISQTGALSPVTGSPFVAVSSPNRLAVSPNGSFVYTFDSLNDGTEVTVQSMEGFSLNTSTGALTSLGAFTGLNVEAAQFDQTGNFLFAVMQNQSTFSTFVLAADPSSGAITASSLPFAGAPSLLFAVTDEP